MFAVVFEVHPAGNKTQAYLDLAAHLKPRLEATDGFLSNERFASRNREGWVLSLSFWRDEKSVVRWRSHGEHHAIQLQGRDGIFSDYHLRVGEVVADSGARDLVQQRFDETEVGDAKALVLTEIGEPEASAALSTETVARDGLELRHPSLFDHDVFESLTTAGHLLLLTAWKTLADAEHWTPRVASSRHRTVRAIRDYGLFDRREAPQFCPIVHRARS